MPKDPERQPFEDARAQVRWMIEQQNRQPRVFMAVKDRDLITLMDRFAGPLEFHSMLVAGQLMAEVSRRQLWDAVLERRTAMLFRMHPAEDVSALRDKARESLDHFRNEHFPIDPDIFGEDGSDAERGWNGYIQF
ncbi:hypothetical protein EDF64_105233 [Curtobacterium flaccumfaciens]|uniref:Uncharacterized protein n=1 Tax=Curtobacterium flaccumfaciens TaxID=2035 RepID=A0A4R6DJT6_9MICO|nr:MULTISPECIES: hypothetical protein [Curtobacterium]TDN44398.1 hypothetical protein EDF64_105233 [Curtobacterium flaccumfaciens]SDQ14332.1 hypothetical protein SAMN02800687_0538 [Curtobacterium sp. UNCCL20]